MSEKVIFDLTNPKCSYKGILFAEGDILQIIDMGMMPVPQKYAPGVMAIIWTDENGIWNMKMRLKFPQSGNKQVYSKSFEKKQQQGVKVNETYILQDIYNIFPMMNKIWTPNPSGDAMGIVKIIEKLDMIEYAMVKEIDATNL